MAPMPPKNGPRYNEFIASPKVRVIDEEGENLGVMMTAEAIEQAASVGLMGSTKATTCGQLYSPMSRTR